MTPKEQTELIINDIYLTRYEFRRIRDNKSLKADTRSHMLGVLRRKLHRLLEKVSEEDIKNHIARKCC